MRNFYFILYIAYLVNPSWSKYDIVLATSNDRSKLKYYLREIRNLTKAEYIIKEVALDEDTAYALYGDYMLEEFSDKYKYLTNRDIGALANEIDNALIDWEGLLVQLKQYRDLVQNTRKLPSDVFDQAIGHMEKHLSSVKIIQRLSGTVIAKSQVMSKNIHAYLKHMGIMEEDRELTELFYKRLQDDD